MAAGSSAAASVTLLLPASVSFLSSSTPSSCPIVSLPSLPSLLPLHNKFVHTVKRPTLCARSRREIVVHVCPMCAQTTLKSRLPSAASPCVSATRLSQHLSKVGSLSAVQQVSGSGGVACPQGEFVSRKLFWFKSKQHVQSKCNSNDSPSACVREGNDQELEGAGMRASSIRQSFITERWTEAGVTGEGEDKSVWELAMTKSGNIRKAVALQLAAAVATGLFLWVGPSALAADPLKTCACLLKECRVELVKCIADPKCAANVACLQTCNGRPDETECQIGCGDLFENKVVDEFNECAVTRKGCVPQKADEGRFPIPPPVALVPNFNTTDFTGQWYISSGLNRTFDTFDCQRHEFSAEPTKLTGNLAWRIPTPDGGFFTRNAVQKFVQDPQQPGILSNRGNEFLNYQDDWYILSSKIEKKPDDYVFVYYRGKNDAWDGYGGAVVYTRSKTLPTSIVPELQRAAKRVNLDFNKFTTTDNTCGPEAPLFARLEKKVEEGEKFVEKEVVEGERFVEKEVEELEQDVEKVGRSLGNAQMSLFGRLGKGAEELRRDEERFFQELGEEEKQILSDLEMEASDVGKLFGKAIPLRKLR